MLSAHPENINWYVLSRNKNNKVLELLQKNPENIDWDCLSKNPNIFDQFYNYDTIKKIKNIK